MTREEVLTHARTRQRYEAPTPAAGEARPALRIILEFDRRRDPEEVAAVIRAQLGLDVTAMLLFAPPQGGEIDPALHGFVAAAIDGVNLEAIEGQAFELSYAIADATGARTAEPELGADSYSEPPEEGLAACRT
jgi:hypothetical protein